MVPGPVRSEPLTKTVGMSSGEEEVCKGLNSEQNWTDRDLL